MAISPEETKRLAVQKLIETKKHNRDEFARFFTELYKAEEDPYAPINIKEEFGADIPDIRKQGESLEEKWPHFFICKLDPKDPTYKDFQPDSPTYQAEFNELVGVVRRVRAHADEINERARALCEQQSQARN